MDKVVILLNGPKGCGKSVATNYLLSKYDNSTTARCKDKLFELTMELFNIDPQTFFEIYENRVEKELPNSLFTVKADAMDLLEIRLGEDSFPYAYINKDEYWISVRTAMILVSEIMVKPYLGNDYFGKVRAESITNYCDIYIDDSAAFVEEIDPLLEKVGQDNILLVRIHGRGDFNGDSRGMLPDGLLKNTIDVYNDSDLESFLKNLDLQVGGFLNE